MYCIHILSSSMISIMACWSKVGVADDGDVTIRNMFRKNTSSFSTITSSIIGKETHAVLVLAPHTN